VALHQFQIAIGGRGDSADTPPLGVEHDIDDIETRIDDVG
jgi:hypothetical protein